MGKIGQQIRFEQIRDFIEQQLSLVAKKPQTDKFESIENRLKDLNKSLLKIEEILYADRKQNRSDVRMKVDNYKQQSSELRRRLDDIVLSYQKKLLLKRPSSSQQLRNNEDHYKMMNELHEGYKNFDRDVGQTAGIIANTKDEVRNQGQRLGDLQDQWNEADAELTMIGQFMSTITNRTLLTKVILVLLVVFLGIADVLILLLRVL